MPDLQTFKPLPPLETLLDLFFYDPKTGMLIWRITNRIAGVKIYQNEKPHSMTIKIGTLQYKIHRIIWKLMTGSDPAVTVDHIDRNPFNNKWKNLREATFVEQLYNTGVHKNNFSGSRGIELRRGMYRARIKIDGKDITIGSYRTLERAIQARLEYIEK
jgi:hypothetical protein